MSAWAAEYPTLEMVNSAAFLTLQTWDKNLPAPQTDVERTVRRRINKQMRTRAGEEVRAKAPDVADRWNDVMGKLEKIANITGMPRM